MMIHPEHSTVRGCFDMVRLEVDTIDDQKNERDDGKQESDPLGSGSADGSS